MTIEQVLRWFIKEQRANAFVRKWYVISAPKKWMADRVRYMTFSEYVDRRVSLGHAEFIFSTMLYNVLCDDVKASAMKDACADFEERAWSLDRKWTYFLSHNIKLNDEVEVGCEARFFQNASDGFADKTSMVTGTVMRLNRKACEVVLKCGNATHEVLYTMLVDKGGVPYGDRLLSVKRRRKTYDIKM